MADKTTSNSSLQASIPFDYTHSPTSHTSTGQTASSSSYSSISTLQTMSGFNSKASVHSKPSMNPISSLMSPPETAPLESFARASPAPSMAIRGMTPVSKSLLSPPVSPYQRITGSEEPTVNVQDPILYPSQDVSDSASQSQPPLFAAVEHTTTQRIVESHMAARALPGHRLGNASPPLREEYRLTLEFKSCVMAKYNANPRRWVNRERDLLKEDQRIRTASYPKLAPRPHHSNPTSGSRVIGSRISKSTHKREGVRPPKLTGPKPRTIKVVRDSATPEPGRRQTTQSTREDRDFNALPDFAPALSTLPNRPNSLKVEWKGAPIDLRNDPHRHLLHEDEVTLAANLRLDCATYLTSKRRIFMSRLHNLRIGKEFRKTDSQQACKIDVNKASKLWMAFDKVGWLKSEHMRKFL